MSLIDLILLGIALGVDCFIVSFSQGLIFTSQRRKNSFKLAITMGLFQGLMPVIGYTAANQFYSKLVPYAKYIVCLIFFMLGLHFILEALHSEDKKEKIQCVGLKCLIGLGVATSIDALFAGSSLKLTLTNLALACFVIGIFSFLMSLCGFVTGNFIKKIPEKYMQILGGIILIILGIKSFY